VTYLHDRGSAEDGVHSSAHIYYHFTLNLLMVRLYTEMIIETGTTQLF